MKRGTYFKLLCMLLLATCVSTLLYGCSESIEVQVAEQLNLGQKYMSELNYEQAIISFKKAIELDPKNSEAYMNLADAYVAIGQVEEALAVLQNIPENVIDVSAITDKIEEIKDLLVVNDASVEEASEQQKETLANEILVVETETQPLDETELKAQEIRNLFNDYDNIENYLKPDELTFYGRSLVGMDIYGIMDVMRERGLFNVDESFKGDTTYYWVHGKSSDDWDVPEISALQEKSNSQDFIIGFDYGGYQFQGSEETPPSYDVGIRGICLGDNLQTVFEKLGYKDAAKMSELVYEYMDMVSTGPVDSYGFPESADINGILFGRLLIGEYKQFLRYSYYVWFGSDYPFDIEMHFRYDKLEELKIEYVDEWIGTGMYESYIEYCEELDNRSESQEDLH